MKFLSDNLLYIFLAILIAFATADIVSQPQTPKNIAAEIKKQKKKITKKIAKISDKKREFCELVVPIVDKVHSELETKFDEISKNLQNEEYKEEISELKKKYKVQTDEELLMALKPHPKSIAIAQAAIESAWATSRFFKEGKNIFGVWSYNKNEPRIAASKTRGTKTIWLKKYNNIEDSIRDYYITLARSRSFKGFRQLKMKTEDPYKLVKKLDHYSELRGVYTKELSSMIRYNKFYKYDY